MGVSNGMGIMILYLMELTFVDMAKEIWQAQKFKLRSIFKMRCLICQMQFMRNLKAVLRP